MIDFMILCVGTCSFIACLAVHIFVWRKIKPLKQLVWLGAIFIIAPLFLYIALSYPLCAFTHPFKYPNPFLKPYLLFYGTLRCQPLISPRIRFFRQNALP